ncbi:MAG: GMC family oxidoreductase [Deltaproteobacteria bacterium]|nr:GMC family oxidoreductase [Deltaproteobacteria bacterium]
MQGVKGRVEVLMKLHYDYIVIGSGFGGSVSALRLAEKGYRVCVFERGKRFQKKDYATTNWQLRKWLWPKLSCTGIQCLTFLRNALILSGAGVGGGSLGYCGVLLEPPEEFFADPQWAGLQDDWLSTLAPFYQKAREMLGATQNPHLWKSDELLREYARDIGREDHFAPTDVGIFFGDPEKEVPDPFFGGKGPPRTGCNEAGCCMVGCNAGGKNSLDRNYLYLAEQLGVNIVPERLVTCVEPSRNGGYVVTTQHSSSLFPKDRKITTAKGVIFAAGALGTNKLLLNLKRTGALPDLSDQVGRTVRNNSEVLVGVSSSDKNERYCDGISITSRLAVDAHTVIEPVRYAEGSDAMGWLSGLLIDGGTRLTRPLKYLWMCIKHPVHFVRTLIPFGWAKRVIILLVMQTHDNRFDFCLKRRWYWPFNHKMDAKRGSSTTPTYIPAANEAAKALAKKINGIPHNAITEVLFNKPLSAHILGGCSIGTDPDDGVIDRRCRVFGYEKMYVVDGSAIPGNPGVNPSLSITALAEYAMSFIPKKENRG